MEARLNAHQAGRARITVRLTPRAARDAIDGWRDGILHVRVTAPPVDNAANDALTRLLAKSLHIAPARISLVSGATSRTKIIALEGVTEADLQAAFAPG